MAWEADELPSPGLGVSGLVRQKFCFMEPIHLQTFCHQVGGGKKVMNFDKTTLCKLLNPKEHYFYLNMPHDLREFTPEFKGLIEVTLQEDSNGYIQYIGYPSDSTDQTSSLPSQQKPPVSCKRTSSISSQNQWSSPGSNSSDQESSIILRDEKKQDESSTCNNSSGSVEVTTHTRTIFHTLEIKESRKSSWVNPWTFKSKEKLTSKIRTIGKDGKTCKFIMLENLATKFKNPCVLDMKMGTRQYGDDDTEEIKQKYIRKCQTSTSSIIGTLIGGMQVYQTNSKKYICHDKYYGRRLSLEGVKRTLYQFLHNGCELRIDVIGAIILQLEKLYEILNELKGFRFYSSSLLLIYEGYQSPNDIDKGQKSPSKRQTNGDVCNCDNSQKRDGQLNCRFYDCKIDIRMIDFVHSTHADLQDEKTTRRVADNGYLFGLRHLIELFTQIKKE